MNQTREESTMPAHSNDSTGTRTAAETLIAHLGLTVRGGAEVESI